MLDGTVVAISRFQRDFAVTKALYRNLVQVAPNEVLRAARKDRSDLLSKHFFPSEMPVACLWNPGSGALAISGSNAEAGYRYHPAYGAYRVAADAAEEPEETERPEFSEAPGLPDIPDERPCLPEPEGEFHFKDNEDW